MSPEQALGLNQELTPQSDVYGLGATLYALVTGRAPFEAESAVELCIKVVREPLAPPRQIVPGIAPDVERIVLRAMHKDRSRRYRTAQALAEDIEKFLAGMPIMDEEELAFTQALGVLREGKLEEAIQLFREAQREGGLEASRRRVARLAEEAGSPAERGAYRLAEAIVRTLEKGSPAEPCGAARAAFAEALKADAGQAEARLGDGLALVLLARVSGEVAKAQALLEEAAGAFTVCAGTPAVRAAAMHNRGIAKFYQARWAEGDRKKALLAGAIADFGIAVGADPGFAYALKDLGVAKLALAQADPSKPLQAAPISESVQHFTRALEIKADLEGALYERGRAYYALGRFAEAVDDWKKCVAIAPLRAKQVAPLVRDAEHALKARKP
jgi:tetratricopeptide (TPR) repeat protein